MVAIFSINKLEFPRQEIFFLRAGRKIFLGWTQKESRLNPIYRSVSKQRLSAGVTVWATLTPTPNLRLNLTLHPKGFEISSRNLLKRT